MHLIHSGTPHEGNIPHSGRFEWGSGENKYQHNATILRSIEDLKKQGITKESEICKLLNLSTTEYRDIKRVARADKKAAELAFIREKREKHWSYQAIGDALGGKGEAYVRYQLKEQTQERLKKSDNVANVLKDAVDGKSYIDIGSGVESYLGVSKENLRSAVNKLKEQGYVIQKFDVEQVTNPGKYTSIKVLCKPGTTYKEIRQHQDEICLIEDATNERSNDGGLTFRGIKPPTSLDSSRVMVRYAEDKGVDQDGVIELRPGVEDISLGESRYAQVRIQVDGTHYIKGMAVYSDSIPDGYDVVFNTNKPRGTPMLGEDKNNTVFKPLKRTPEGDIDEQNPFGTTLRMEAGKIVGQREYIDENGKKQLSPVNIVRAEGDWDTWSKTLSSQFLSKQPLGLIRDQLNKTFADKKTEFNELLSITNPEAKKKLLEDFAESCDSDAVHLKAAALPRQSSKVILPLPDIKENEVYAPGYRDGEHVVLIRYPHGGTFEIPELVVHNTGNKQGKLRIGNSVDAIGIHPKAAQQLSGADFDGDTVTLIPIGNDAAKRIEFTKQLKGLENFEPKEVYRYHEGMQVLQKKNVQREMGIISNLITDMTIKGASPDELVRAVRHSMVIIDAEKHKLDYKQSEKDNGIAQLKKKWQNGGGADTLISRSKSEVTIPDRKEKLVSKMTPEEKARYDQGEKIWEDTGRTASHRVVDKKTGEVTYEKRPKTIKSTKMYETDDPYSLVSSPTSVKENIYAGYASKLKALANEARKAARIIAPTKVNATAKKTYAEQIKTILSKLNVARKNAPLERKAQLLANSWLRQFRIDHRGEDLTNDEVKKARTQYMSSARQRTGASKIDRQINLTDKEWEAMMAGAVSSSVISEILTNLGTDRVKAYAIPHNDSKISASERNRIQSLDRQGYTLSEIADSMHLSPSTVSAIIKGKED